MKNKIESFEDFHKFVIWGQKQNKKNPGKFGTVEMYSFLAESFEAFLYAEKEKGTSIEEILKKTGEQTDINFTKLGM